MKIYHNPRCRKSRETLELIQKAGIEPEIIYYLKQPPSEAELKEIVEMLGISPEDLLRKGEAIYKEQYKGKTYRDEQWINIMTKNPKLIERPIVIANGKAVIGRPPEKVKSLL